MTEDLIRARRDDVKAVILRVAVLHDKDCRATFLSQQAARIFERLPGARVAGLGTAPRSRGNAARDGAAAHGRPDRLARDEQA